MNKFQTILLAAAVSMLAAHAAVAGETKAPKAVGVAVPPEASNAVSSVGNLAGGAGGGAAAASYAREASPGPGECTPARAPVSAPAPAPAASAAKDTMPNRISMNVTVPKQTQGATFGEKVNQGLHASGGSLGQAASQVGASVPGGAVISARCAQAPVAPPMETPAPTDK